MSCPALDYVNVFSSLAEYGEYCIARLSGGWGWDGSGSFITPESVLCVSKSCFVYFMSFRVKLLNINIFAQPQRMRINNAEGVMQKKSIIDL